MYFSIILGVLTISTEEIETRIKLNEIVAYELVSLNQHQSDVNEGIVSIYLKGNNKELVYHCKGKKSWANVIEWFKDYENEIIEGMTQEIAKNNKKARF